MKQIIVQKYGGTSVGSIERIRAVAKRVSKAYSEGYMPIVVVSAMGKSTDDLVNMAYALNKNPSKREMDMLLSTGEQITISLLAMALQDLDHQAISLTGRQCGILTTNFYSNARIEKIETDRIEKELSEDKIVIIAGFQGFNEHEDITTLGRGGSDTTAVAIAAAVNAKKCEIYTDVDGVYTCDPRRVKDAAKLSRISYDEMLEMASLGAGVLHPRSVELARKFNMPLEVRSSFKEDEGTIITGVDCMEKSHISGVSIDNETSKISLLGVPDMPGIAFKLFSKLAKENIKVDLIIQGGESSHLNDINFTVKSSDFKDALRVCEAICSEIGAQGVSSNESISKISLIGTGILGNAHMAEKFFHTLYDLGINIQMISTSEIKISCIIDREYGAEALNKLHNEFELHLAN